MNRYLLDTSAFLTLRDNESGTDQIAGLLRHARDSKAQCFASFITQMEILYCIWKTENKLEAWLAYEQCQSLPVTWVHEDKRLLEKAAELKATYSISVANAWIAACAILKGATLVHKDPELEQIDHPQLILSYKTEK